MSKFRLQIPKDLRSSPEERAALAVLVRRSLGKKVHRIAKDEYSLLSYYDMVTKLKRRVVYYLDFEYDFVMEDVEEVVKPFIELLKSVSKAVYRDLMMLLPRIRKYVAKVLRR